MKIMMRAMLLLALVAVAFPPIAGVGDIEWLGRVSGFGGVDRESNNIFSEADAGRVDNAAGGGIRGLGAAELMWVIPVYKNFGFQAQVGAGGGRGSKINLNAGPVMDWGSGKIGVFYLNQWRNYPDANNPNAGGTAREWYNSWIRPAASYYFDSINIDWTMGIPLTHHKTSPGKFGDGMWRAYYPGSDMRLALNFFPELKSLGKDNLEITVGMVLNDYAGVEQSRLQTGVGGALGLALMPMPNLEVTAFRAQLDSRGKFQVLTGLQYYFDFAKAPSTLLQLRRKYLDMTNQPGRVSSVWVR